MESKDKKIQEKNTHINNEELFKAIAKFIIFMMVSVFFGYCGYTYCIDNNYNILKGIVFGALLPMILFVIDDKFGLGIIKFVILVIAWICICEYIPLFIGIIALTLVIVYGVWKIVNAYNNRTMTETTTIYEKDGNKTNNTKIDTSYYYDTNKKHSKYNDTNIDFDEYEYYCERCDKRISEEEYIENCGLCEDCDAEVYFGERYDGDDYDLYR